MRGLDDGEKEKGRNMTRREGKEDGGREVRTERKYGRHGK